MREHWTVRGLPGWARGMRIELMNHDQFWRVIQHALGGKLWLSMQRRMINRQTNGEIRAADLARSLTKAREETARTTAETARYRADSQRLTGKVITLERERTQWKRRVKAARRQALQDVCDVLNYKPTGKEKQNGNSRRKRRDNPD